LTGSLIHIRQKDQENRTRNRIEIASGPLWLSSILITKTLTLKIVNILIWLHCSFDQHIVRWKKLQLFETSGKLLAKTAVNDWIA
jgi:hypothetical protein